MYKKAQYKGNKNQKPRQMGSWEQKQKTKKKFGIKSNIIDKIKKVGFFEDFCFSFDS